MSKTTTKKQAPAVNSESKAPTSENLTGEAMQAPQAPAPDIKGALNELQKANNLLNDGLTRGAHASKLNSIYFQKVIDQITIDHGVKHAFDVTQGAALFLRHELRLAFKAKEKEGAARSVSIDQKKSIESMESAKRLAYDCFLAYQSAAIAKEKAYKAGLLYARPASE